MLDRNFILVGAAVFFGSVTSFAAASLADPVNGPYASLLVGGVSTDDAAADNINIEYDTGFALSGQFGYQFSNLRLGAELGYQLAEGLSSNNVNSDVHITRFTINGYVDLPLASNISPYAGGGFGVAGLRSDGDFEADDTAFTWHGEAGIAFKLNEQFSIAPTYRYQWIDTDLGGQTEPLKSHIFGATLRYQFYSSAPQAYADAPPARGGAYGAGYSGYRSYDRYDDDDYHHRRRYQKPKKTPEEKERDRCGWKGAGCEDEEGDGWVEK